MSDSEYERGFAEGFKKGFEAGRESEKNTNPYRDLVPQPTYIPTPPAIPMPGIPIKIAGCGCDVGQPCLNAACPHRPKIICGNDIKAGQTTCLATSIERTSEARLDPSIQTTMFRPN